MKLYFNIKRKITENFAIGRLILLIACAPLCAGAESKLDRLIEHYEARLSQDPDNPIISVQLGGALLRGGEKEQGLELIQKVYERSYARLSGEPENGHVYYVLGLCSAFQGKNYLALSHFKRAVEFAPGYAPAATALAKIHLEQGRVEQSVFVLKNAIIENPKNESIRRALAEVYKANERNEEAIEDFEALARDFPDSERYFNHLLELYLKTGDMSKASNSFDALVNRGTITEADKFLRLAQMQLDNENYREVPRLLQQVKKLDEEHPALNAYFAKYYTAVAQKALDDDQLSRATLFWKRAYEYSPEDEGIIGKLGYVYMLQEDYTEANEYFMVLLKKQPESPEYYSHFAQTLNALGKSKLAYEIIGKGYEISRKSNDAEAMKMFVETRRLMTQANQTKALEMK